MKKMLKGYQKMLIAVIFIIAFLVCLPHLISGDYRVYPKVCMMAKNNYFEYQTGEQSAAYASAYLLRYLDQGKPEINGEYLYENFSGKTTPEEVLEIFRNQGYTIEFKKSATINDLKWDLSLMVPVIAVIRADPENPEAHYVPIIGYDTKYFYMAENRADLANYQTENRAYNRKITIKEYKKLCKDVENNYNCPYFVISEPK